jgi:hypothetical protein
VQNNSAKNCKNENRDKNNLTPVPTPANAILFKPGELDNSDISKNWMNNTTIYYMLFLLFDTC